MTLVRKGQGGRRIIPPDTGAQLIEVPLAQQISVYLSRLRYSIPFPCTTEDAYFGMVPRAIESWYRAGVFEQQCVIPGRESNLLSTMFSTWEKTRVTRDYALQSNVLHVCVETAAEYIDSLKGIRGCERVFWFVAPAHVPLPRNSQQVPFFLAQDHPHYTALQEWAVKATFLEDEIAEAINIVTRYAAVVQSGAQLLHTWPELTSFCRFKRSAMGIARKDLEERVAAVVDKRDKEKVTDLLATTVLLPEKQPMLQAWVQFHTTRHTPV